MLYVFFFSSRRRHTRLQGDWSSDVCSSDLAIESAVRGELYCPPRVAFTLLRRLGALAASLRDDEEKATHSPLRALTGREREILHLVDDGMTNKGIAGRLVIELATVKNHVHNILKKLHVHRRIDASAWYRRRG